MNEKSETRHRIATSHAYLICVRISVCVCVWFAAAVDSPNKSKVIKTTHKLKSQFKFHLYILRSQL